jgi:hypothetical protein
MERMDELGDQRASAVVGLLADVNDLVGVAAIVLSLEQDNGLQRELRRCAQVQDDRALVVQLPIGGAGMELLPRGGTRPLRIDALRGAVSLEQLALENVTIQDRLRAKGSSLFQAAQAILRSILQPGYLPSRTEYQKLERLSPMIERTAYRLCARSMAELDACGSQPPRGKWLEAIFRSTVCSRSIARRAVVAARIPRWTRHLRGVSCRSHLGRWAW